jgi:dihydroorotate dehydrogenase
MATSLADESMANSVGVPSTEPTAWQASLNATRERLGPGQRLIASVMGSPEVATSPSELASDIALAVKLAAETSTDAIELNLSCPNTRGAIVCQSPDIAVEVCAAAAAAIASSAKPLLAKVSYLPPDALEAFTLACAPHLQGVIAINTVAQQIVDHAGQPYFPGRPTAGISGRAIFEAGLDTVRRLTALRTAHRLDLAIIGVGGVMTPGDFDAYLEAGANAVQTCTGAYLYPTLAITYRRQHAQRAAKSAVVASVS